jgi:hypothetical protein
MQIRFSKYNSPFSEPSTQDIHYISLDDQRDLKSGYFAAHVHLYFARFVIPPSRTFRTFRTDDLIEVFDPLSGATRVHDLSGSTFLPNPIRPTVPANDADLAFVDQLRKTHIKAAIPRMALCSCGNANRPWRCKCNR